MQSGDTFGSTTRDWRLPTRVVVIAAGTGGPQALMEILPRIPSQYPGAIVVLQQMRPGFSKVLTSQLNEVCRLRVVNPVDGQDLCAAEILMVPAGCHVVFSGNARMIRVLDVHDDPEAAAKAVDNTMTSAANAFGANAIGVLLTGFGDDGRAGMKAIYDAGGETIAQDEESATIFDLPSSAIEARVVNHVLPLWSIADQIAAREVLNADAA